jgi:hypothetical protein
MKLAGNTITAKGLGGHEALTSYLQDVLANSRYLN